MTTAPRAPGLLVLATNTNPGASCAKELKSVKCDSRGPGDGVPRESSRHNIYIQ